MTLPAIHQASYIYAHRHDRQLMVDGARSLSEWGIFSNNHIASITGLTPRLVGELTGKKDRRGGAFDPEGLGEIQAAALNPTPESVRAALGSASPGLVSRLTGVSERTVRRWAA